jgi:hypothetical protein
VSLAAWNAFFFPTGGAGSAHGDDFDGDGVTNYLEYTATTNPRSPGYHIGLLPRLVRESTPGSTSYVFSLSARWIALGSSIKSSSPPI